MPRPGTDGAPIIVLCGGLPLRSTLRVRARLDEIQSDAHHAFACAGIPIQIAAVFDLLEGRGHALVQFDHDVRAAPARRAFGDHAQKAAHLEANNVERDPEVAFRRQFRIGYAVHNPVERVKRRRAISGLESVRHAPYEFPFAAALAQLPVEAVEKQAGVKRGLHFPVGEI